MTADALRLHADDTVVVALRDLPGGGAIRWRGGADAGDLALDGPVPLGHKISLRAVRQGEAVRKYGSAIGVAARDIAPGTHVHVHNLSSARAGRGP